MNRVRAELVQRHCANLGPPPTPGLPIRTRLQELEARQRELAQRSNVMSDASVLAALQAAIERLEQELRGMDVRIGLTSSLLLDAQTGAA